MGWKIAVVTAAIIYYYIYVHVQERVTPYIPQDVVDEYKFINLSQGQVRYKLIQSEPGKKPLVVFVHGFSASLEIWGDVPTALAKKYDVLVFDLYGRGYSDSSPLPNNAELFVAELAELMFALSLEKIDSLVGLSLGGAIASTFAKIYPEKVKTLVLLAPAGLPVPVPFISKIGSLPIIGEILYPLLGPGQLSQYIIRNFAYPEDENTKRHVDEMKQLLSKQIENHRGFLHSILSTVRHFPLGTLRSTFEEIGTHSRPVLIIWGDKDIITPFQNAADLHAILARSELKVIPDAGHGDLLLGKQTAIINAIQDFLRRQIK